MINQRGKTMTAIHFFQVKGPAIARNCSVTIEGRTITIHGVWTGNTAIYRSRSSAEVLVIRACLARSGAVVAEVMDE